jgi:siroheme synthase (precorrin-2 oxidase/ferrochelatase)
VRYLPIAVDVAGRSAVVIGATEETVTKVVRLLDAGARVTVFATGAVHPDVLARDVDGDGEVTHAPDPRALAAGWAG